MAGSALFFSVMSMLVKVAAERGLPPMEIVLVRCAVMTVFTAGLARAVGQGVAGGVSVRRGAEASDVLPQCPPGDAPGPADLQRRDLASGQQGVEGGAA